jgi:Arylsulfotransferase (ASST)
MMTRGSMRASVAVLLGGLSLGLPSNSGAQAGERSAGGPSAPASPAGLQVMPFPGTPDAAPSTNIIFSSLRPANIASVSVIGSRSGEHSGGLSALPDGAGTAFTPDRPFTPGEQVEVSATLRPSQSGGTAHGSSSESFSFRIAVPAQPTSGAPMAQAATTSRAAAACPVCMKFHSLVDFHPPLVRVTSDPDTTSGDIFITPRHSNSRHLPFQAGPMIIDARGRLVWFTPIHFVASDLQVEHYRGHPVLTWWQGLGTGLSGRGQDIIMDNHYRTVATILAKNGLNADNHEFQITPQGTALLEAEDPVKANLSSMGGSSSGTVFDYVIQEIDIKTGKLLWQWNAMGHIPLSASYVQPQGSHFDYLHMNSIQQLPNHNLVISARNTWGIYEIDRQTGRIVWRLGGKGSSFRIGSGGNFSWQHDAHLNGNTLSLFDDASNGGRQEENESSAKVLRLNFGARTATLVRRFYHSPPLIAPSQGSAQYLPNGNMFVGWGAQPDFSEYRRGGHQIFNGYFPFFGAQSYRAYRFHWRAQPLTKPTLALDPQSDGSVQVYAAWNGATDVASWRVLGGSNRSSLHRLGGRSRTGFETRMRPHSEPDFLQVQALSSSGHVLGSSSIHADLPHVAIFTPTSFVRSSEGTGAVPVGCFTRQTCHMSVTVSSGNTVLARVAHPVARGTGALLYYKLSGAGISRLAHASNHRLPVTVAVHDSASGLGATRSLTLIPYSIAGTSARSASQSPSLQLLQRPGFVSSSGGIGQILAACYAPGPCKITTTVSAGGKRIAHTGGEYLGADELGILSFKLSSAGRSMLRHASGNQLPAQIRLNDGSDTATGQLPLVSYR